MYNEQDEHATALQTLRCRYCTKIKCYAYNIVTGRQNTSIFLAWPYTFQSDIEVYVLLSLNWTINGRMVEFSDCYITT